jgi:SNF family Na+-dependent transporter
MSDTPELALPQKENWSSKLGVVLAVAGSAVGLGNFLRFPGQAANHGGGAFMIPYVISFIVLGIPIAWCEWTMGRMGGRLGQNSAPGIMYALWRKAPAKAVGAMTLLIPVTIYMYYVLLEAWCLDYCIEFIRGGFADSFSKATSTIAEGGTEVEAIVGTTDSYFNTTWGRGDHGALFHGGRTIWLVLACFLVNFYIIYQGVTRGIEIFCKWAMPALILCALIILLRVLTLDDISIGLGFMWNPQWTELGNPKVWLAASGQIFFSLSVGFGLILCYSSYVRSNEDVVLTSLSASSANEFCEVILGGMIVVPTAFLFLGAESATAGTFGLGFVTVPAIMHFMPGGHFFGAMWFGLLFLAAVTSSLSMLQPAIAFLEDGFGLRRRSSVTILGIITALGALPVMYFSRESVALDHTDFWCNLMMIVAATCQVLIFGWIIGARRGVAEMNYGADFKVPRFVAFVIRFVTPTFLIVVLVMWAWTNLPSYWHGMDPEYKGLEARRTAYVTAIEEHFADEKLTEEQLEERAVSLLGPEGTPVTLASLPEWLRPEEAKAEEKGAAAAEDASIARFVFLGILVFYILLWVLSDLACRYRIKPMIERAENAGINSGAQI